MTVCGGGGGGGGGGDHSHNGIEADSVCEGGGGGGGKIAAAERIPGVFQLHQGAHRCPG